MQFEFSEQFATKLDNQDRFRSFRDRFYIPQHNHKDTLYFTGNSLGLMPKSTPDYINKELESWKTYGVEGHFKGDNPWMYYHKIFSHQLADLVGAIPTEVVAMNTLTTNLHLLLVSFYKPMGKRNKIMMEAGAFPSDQYAIETQVKFHGGNPKTDIIEIAPRAGEYTLRTEDILTTIDEHKDEIATIMFGGVNYYTGQLFDMKTITEAGHKIGAKVGFDLAHAIGNVVLELHNWGVDFACWCSYKYLNSGPGGVAGIFVNDRYAEDHTLNRFAGWWGHKEEERFQMKKGFIPMYGAEAWQQSNAQVLSMAAHKASLDIFIEAGGIKELNKKSKELTSYLFYCLTEANRPKDILVITPCLAEERGAQISILTGDNCKQIFDKLTEEGVVADWREPNVIRVAPVPLYNSFTDVYRFAKLLNKFAQ